MKIKSLFASVMASVVAFVACENEKVDLGTPSIALSLEEVTLEAAGGKATVDVTATRDWTVKFDETADWLVVDPASGTASADAQQVTISALSNEGYDREVSVEFSIGMQTKYLTVKQAGPKGAPAVIDGDGTEASPYSASKANELASALGENDKKSGVYVQGIVKEIKEVNTQYGNATYYITDEVGSVKFYVFRGNYLAGAKFTAENQIKVGDNVVIYGDLMNYKGNSPQLGQGNYIVKLNGTGSTGGEVTPPTDAIFFESFAAGKGDFTIDDKTVPAGFTAVWEHSTQYTCMKATAYKNDTEENFASESWLISPEIDLAGKEAAFLTFDHAGGYFGTPANEATLWISKDGGAWTQLAIAESAYPTGWTFISAGKWDLAEYLGGKIKIAFKYTSTATKAGTWEIKNVCVSPTGESTGGNTGGGNTGGGDNGDGGLTPPSDGELDPNATIITLDASSKLCDAFPEGSTGVNVTTSYTIDGYDWTFSPSSGNKFSWYTDGYVLWGKKNGYILLPSVEGKSLSWVLILTGKNASVSVQVGVYSEDGTIAVTGGEPIILNAKNSEFTYNLSDTEVGARYRFQIVNDKNAQFQKLTLIYE